MSQQHPLSYCMDIYEGSYFQRVLTYKVNGSPKDLTGYTARGSIRTTYSSPLFLAFSCTIPNPIDGKIFVELLATDTVGKSLASGVYDIELLPPTGEAYATRILMGDCSIGREVTKP